MDNIDVKDKHWKHYLTRPFSLFETSIWHEWYRSLLMEKLVGIKLEDGLYVEYPAGNIRHYREASEIDLFIKSAQNIALDRDKSLMILKKGLELNQQGEKYLVGGYPKDLSSAVDFLISLALYAGVLPYFIGHADTTDQEILDLVNQLRSVSYYPKILNQVIFPLAIHELKKNGVNDLELVKSLTLKEILSGQIVDRLLQRKSYASFVYKNIGGVEQIYWTNEPEIIINRIEGEINWEKKEIKGSVACRGKVRGTVRVIRTNNIVDFEFKRGDILVSASTNPALLPLMQKSGAIVTDEGGITSHAAIISRELGIPCIIGTKNATRLLNDGDMVEVDAEQGIVRFL